MSHKCCTKLPCKYKKGCWGRVGRDKLHLNDGVLTALEWNQCDCFRTQLYYVKCKSYSNMSGSWGDPNSSGHDGVVDGVLKQFALCYHLTNASQTIQCDHCIDS